MGLASLSALHRARRVTALFRHGAGKIDQNLRQPTLNETVRRVRSDNLQLRIGKASAPRFQGETFGATIRLSEKDIFDGTAQGGCKPLAATLAQLPSCLRLPRTDGFTRTERIKSATLGARRFTAIFVTNTADDKHRRSSLSPAPSPLPLTAVGNHRN